MNVHQNQDQDPSSLFVNWSNEDQNPPGGPLRGPSPLPNYSSTNSGGSATSFSPFLFVPRDFLAPQSGDLRQQRQPSHSHQLQKQQLPPQVQLQDGLFLPSGEPENHQEKCRGNILSNPIPDYLVAPGSSPFTLQAQAPHFQPRPRALASSFALAPSQSLDPGQRYQIDWDFQYRQHQQHRPPSSSASHPPSVPGHLQSRQDAERRDGGGNEPEMKRMGQGGSLGSPHSTPHIGRPVGYNRAGPRDDASHNDGERGDQRQFQHQQRQVSQADQHLQQQRVYVSASSTQEGFDDLEEQDNGGEGELDAAGKKIRKKRRLKGELPRDHALRKYKCDECEQKFARPSALVTHILTHTKEKPFVCPTCNRGFAVMSNLRRHCRVRKHYTSVRDGPPLYTQPSTEGVNSQGTDHLVWSTNHSPE